MRISVKCPCMLAVDECEKEVSKKEVLAVKKLQSDIEWRPFSQIVTRATTIGAMCLPFQRLKYRAQKRHQRQCRFN